MNSKEYKLPNGKKAVFEYDHNGVGKITLECMDMLMGQLIAYKRCIQSRSFWDGKHCDDCMFYDDCPFNPREDEDEPNCSEKPNNCEHITEDGVTCAKYPACDDCLNNPLNKLKGSERLVKGSEQTDCQTCKWGEWYRQGYDITMMDDECGGCCSWNSKWTPKTEPTISKMEQVDEPQTYVINPQEPTNDDKCFECDDFFICGGQCNKIEDEPQTEVDCSWK